MVEVSLLADDSMPLWDWDLGWGPRKVHVLWIPCFFDFRGVKWENHSLVFFCYVLL
jgi:hypothetical protein